MGLAGEAFSARTGSVRPGLRYCYAGNTITFVLTGVRSYRCIMS